MAEAAATWLAETLAAAGALEAADVALAVADFAATYGAYVQAAAVVASVYTLREQQRRARNAYNASLRDRYVMQRAASESRKLLLGRVRVSGPIAFMHSSGDNNTKLSFAIVLAAHECDAIEEVYFNDEPVILDNDGAVIGIKRTERFSLNAATSTFTLSSEATEGTCSAVVTYASGDVTLGVSLSDNRRELTVAGGHVGEVGSVKVTYQAWDCPYVDNKFYDSQVTNEGVTSSSGVFTVPESLIPSSVFVAQIGADGKQSALPFTVNLASDGTPLTVSYSGATVGQKVRAMYQKSTAAERLVLDPLTGLMKSVFTRLVGTARARVRKYLGAPGQTADAGLISNAPGLWTTAHKGEGLCYLVVELDYDETAFSSGVPNISAVVRGLKCYDPRTGTTAWTLNPALQARAYYLHELGARRSASEVDDVSVIAAANVCDLATTYTVGAHSHTRARYQSSIVISTDLKPQDALTDLTAAMGGRWVIARSKLRLRAGAYSSPVAAITPSWLHSGSPVSIRPAAARSDVINDAVGTFADEENDYRAVSYPRVTASELVEDDGNTLSTDISYQAVTFSGQAQYLTACAIRYNRAGMTVTMACNMRAYPLEVFDVVTLTLPRFGLDAQTFEVVSTGFTLDGLVELALKYVDPSIWEVDSVFSSAGYAPKSLLPSPTTWNVGVPTIGTPLSGTAQLLAQSDGTIVSRIFVPLSVSDPSVSNGGYIEVAYREVTGFVDQWEVVRVAGDSTGVYLAPVNDGRYYLIKARGVNGLTAGVWSVQTNVRVSGKSEAPSDVSGFSAAPGIDRITFSWARCSDADYMQTEVRMGSDWEAGSVVFSGATTGFDMPWPGLGVYTFLARHQDTSGNQSLTTASLALDLNAPPAAPTVSIEVQQSDYILRWTEVATRYPLATYKIRIGATLAASTELDSVRALERRATVDWSTEQRFWVAAVDIMGNQGEWGTVAYSVPTPDAGAVEVDGAGNVVLTFTKYTDPQINAYELRQGEDWDSAVYVAETTGDSFKLPLAAVLGNTYLIRGRYDVGYTLKSTRISFASAALTAPTGLTWRVQDSTVVWSWSPVPGAAQYAALWEDSGVTVVRVVTDATLTVPIPRGAAVLRLIAVSASGSVSAYVDEELSLTGLYRLNELVSVSLPLSGSKCINLAVGSSSTIRRVSARGADAEAPYAYNINDADLFAKGYNLAAVTGGQLADTPAEWFRDGWWRLASGYAESGVIDLGEVLEGQLSVGLAKTVTYLGDVSVDTYGEVLAAHLADATALDLADRRAFVTASIQVATDNPASATWRDVKSGDWVQARYVRLVIEVAMASPLTEISITAGEIVIDVPDVVQAGTVEGVTSAGITITWPKPFHAVTSVIHSARGTPKSELVSFTPAGMTIKTDSATPTIVDYQAKGY